MSDIRFLAEWGTEYYGPDKFVRFVVPEFVPFTRTWAEKRRDEIVYSMKRRKEILLKILYTPPMILLLVGLLWVLVALGGVSEIAQIESGWAIALLLIDWSIIFFVSWSDSWNVSVRHRGKTY